MMRLVTFLLALMLAVPALAQDTDPILASTQALDQAATEYQAIDAALNGRAGASQAQALKDRAAAV